jgi:hypothetical protein
VFRRVAIVLVGTLVAAGAVRADVALDFIPSTRAEEYDARMYRSIWEEYGERIVAALERHTCLPFPEPRISAVIAEATSHSGGPEHPMQLRASYIRQVKQSTLVHELGHRHLWQLTERLDGIDGHMTLYLVLDRIWADIWGEQFAEERIRDERGWEASYDYSAAWEWARSLEPDKRAGLWNELLVMNGFADRCTGSIVSARQ